MNNWENVLAFCKCVQIKERCHWTVSFEDWCRANGGRRWRKIVCWLDFWAIWIRKSLGWLRWFKTISSQMYIWGFDVSKKNWTDHLILTGDFVLRRNKEKCTTFLQYDHCKTQWTLLLIEIIMLIRIISITTTGLYYVGKRICSTFNIRSSPLVPHALAQAFMIAL